MTSDQKLIKEMEHRLIKLGVRPNLKKYSKVRPRGLYMLMPSMWRTARALEQAHDFSFDIIMNQFKTALQKERLEQLRRSRL